MKQPIKKILFFKLIGVTFLFGKVLKILSHLLFLFKRKNVFEKFDFFECVDNEWGTRIQRSP